MGDSSSPLPLTVVVEGMLDEAVVRRLAADTGLGVERVLGHKGKDYIRTHLLGLSRAARGSPILVLCDLDDEFPCAAALKAKWLAGSSPPETFALRICVREVESWLLADREALADVLRVSKRVLPDSPDDVAKPKARLLEVAARSSDRSVRIDFRSVSGMPSRPGPGYQSRLGDFVARRWSPARARARSKSLDSCLKALDRLRAAVART